MAGTAFSLTKNLTKLAIGAGAVYLTIDQGVWSSENSLGASALNKVRQSVLPAATEYVEKIPSCDSVSQKASLKWNSGVKTLFGWVENAPDTVKDYSKKAVSSAKSLIQQKS